ncbi:MAG: SprB repeat-containing protein, partial [Saprospiraceae bacterium]
MVLFKNTFVGVLYFFSAILTPIALSSQTLQVKIDLKLDVSCFGGADGAIFLVAEQGTPPYFYEWNTGETSASLVNLAPGVYTCTVTDSGGDTEVVNVPITQPSAPIQVQADSLRRPDCTSQKGYIRAKALGGTPPYQYEWSNG